MSTLCRCKVGLSIRIQVDNGWKTEIAVFEFKTSTSTREMCEKQQKKSMRLHVAILSGLEARGLDLQRSYPIVAEGRGQVLDFYTLRRHEDGRSTAKGISLPSQVSQLKTFLYSNSVLTLLSFRVSILTLHNLKICNSILTYAANIFEPNLAIRCNLAVSQTRPLYPLPQMQRNP